MKDEATRWICCQLGAREHYAVARALHLHEALDLLVTDAWITAANPLGKIKPSLRARFHADLAKASVYAPNCGGIAFELKATIVGLRNWARIIARNRWFQKMAVTRLSRMEHANSSRTIMAYSYAALEIFKLARVRGWRTVLGQIDPGPLEDRLVAKLYDENSDQRGRFERPPAPYWSSWREECALADRIVVNSLWSQECLVSEGVPAAKIRVVPLAYEIPMKTASFRREYPVIFTASRPLRVLFLGQINLRKGVGPLLDAIRLLQGEPIEFIFVGPIQLSIPTDLRRNPQVRWVGAVPHEFAAQFYRDADLFLFPTFSDGFGLTQLEAQAWKLPIVATKCCGSVVEDGRNGWLLSEITPAAIAAIISRCRMDPSRLLELSANSVPMDRFNLDQIGIQWLNTLA